MPNDTAPASPAPSASSKNLDEAREAVAEGEHLLYEMFDRHYRDDIERAQFREAVADMQDAVASCYECSESPASQPSLSTLRAQIEGLRDRLLKEKRDYGITMLTPTLDGKIIAVKEVLALFDALTIPEEPSVMPDPPSDA